MKNVKTVIIAILAVTYSVLLLIFSETVGENIRNAILSCLTVIIPSLFAFMVMCDYLIASNLYKLLSRPFGVISRYIFRVEPELFSVILLSSVAGYPIGARLIDGLYRQDKADKKTQFRYHFIGYNNCKSKQKIRQERFEIF